MNLSKLASILTIIGLLMLSPGAALVYAEGPDGSGTPATEETPTVAAAQEATDTPTLEATVEVTPTEEVTVAPTEEATVAPTVEATVAPTEEVTPTVEATVEPTEEATVAPTVEATVAPTEEVTPTEEATVVPTVEATVEPTEEVTVTVTPTVEATVTATPTVEATPTVTPTEVITPTPVVDTSGEINAQALPGTWSSEYIGIQNLGSAAADTVLQLYAQGSSSPTYESSFSIPVNGNKSLATSSMTGLGSGAYAGIVASSEQVAAGVINTNATAQASDAYLGVSNPSTKQIIPGVLRNYSGFNTLFHIQNATETAQSVRVSAYRMGATTPASTPQYTIQGNTSLTVDMGSSAFSAFGNYVGYVVIEGLSGNIAAVAECDGALTTGNISLYISGVDSTAAVQDLVAPGVLANWAGFNTGLNVVNMGNTATTVTMTYNKAGGGKYVFTQTIAKGGSYNWNMAALNVPKPSYGGVQFHSSATPIVALMTFTQYAKTLTTGFSTTALNPASATTKVAVPVALQLGLNGEWNTGVAVYSVGHAGNIKTTWVKANTNPPQMYVVTLAGTLNGMTSFNAASLVSAGKIPSNFVGSVYVEAQGAGQTVLGVVSHTNYKNGHGGQQLGFNY